MNKLLNREDIAAIISGLPDPVIVINQEKIIVASNGAAETMFASTLLDKHLSFVLRVPAVLQATVDALTEQKTAKVQYQLRGPIARSFDVHVSPLGGTCALLSIRDLTHVENIERMRSDFVANASHELRTPLATLSGFIETMQGSAKNDPKARDQFLTIMKAQADRMAALIDDLLSLSRIEISEHVAPNEKADLAQIARQSRDLLIATAKDVDCEIRMVLPATLPVIGDAQQLSQVIYNLMENAIKYGASGKRIDVIGRALENTVELSVRDHGPGIAAHHVPRLTERFYRVNVQDSRSRGGTGLGLAISKHIINRHRGKLLIESEIGQGSNFTIVLQNNK